MSTYKTKRRYMTTEEIFCEEIDAANEDEANP